MSIDHIAVLGGGAWGTALANVAASGARRVTLWGRDGAYIEAIRATGENTLFLPGARLAASVAPTSRLADVRDAGALILAVPAQALRAVARDLTAIVRDDIPVITCAKGIEQTTGLFMSEVLADVLPRAYPMVLSGPSFAADVAAGLPTAVVLAAADALRAAALAEELSGPAFRVYHGNDVRGVEIGGAAKNVLAIACGIVVGRRLGESARAALVARGFAELTRFARANGGRPETLMGLSGLGDLVLTASSPQSRNFAFGEALGRGVTVAQAMGAGKLIEGALTAPVLAAKARAKGIDMPVASAVDAVIGGRLSVDRAIEALMMRPIKSET
jgi:glycerol-3-phosphate dehydrogenase (NAD(P)+)